LFIFDVDAALEVYPLLEGARILAHLFVGVI
jgi:hypothetical protein